MNNYQYHIYPSMKCSLACRHCFIDKEVLKQKDTMTVEQFKTVADKYAEHFRKNDVDFGEITIIGGEPTLIPSAFYHEVIPYLRKSFEDTGKPFMISIVTNMMHYKNLDKMSELFDLVVTSYEPARFTEENMVSGIERKGETWHSNLDEYVKTERPVSVSFSTSGDVIEAGTELLDHFFDRGIRFLQINSIVPEGNILENEMGEDFYQEHLGKRTSEFAVPVKKRKRIALKAPSIIPDYELEADYFIKITEWMYDKIQQGHDVDVYPVKSFIHGVINDSEVDDISCCIDKGMNTRPDGKVTGCASEIGSKVMLSYGNIYEDKVDDIQGSDIKRMHLSMAQRLDKECMTCEFIQSCMGSCMLRSRFWDKAGKVNSCHGLKPYMRYIKDNKERLKTLL
ncbi:SPASM domain-containing protein [Vibrio splendidus]|nr:SPASM domain-containing protein [Vibrio splendidus]MCC4880514.1 SPASM domain-containing protein [Vibrio splendidus]